MAEHRIIRNQILAGTNTDVHGDRISREELKDLFEQLPDRWVMTSQHDMTVTPSARAFNKSLREQPDGSLVMCADVEILDEGAFAAFGGFSVAFCRHRLTNRPERAADVEVLFNPRAFSAEEIGQLIKVANDEFQLDGRELIQKAVDPSVVLVFKFAVGAFFSAFCASAGSDAWKAVKSRLKQMSVKRLERSQRLECQCHVPLRIGNRNAKLIVAVDSSDLDALASEQGSILDQLRRVAGPHIKGAAIALVALRFDTTSKTWVFLHAITETNEIIVPDDHPAA